MRKSFIILYTRISNMERTKKKAIETKTLDLKEENFYTDINYTTKKKINNSL